jgi:CspA family cold shock protein
MAEGKVKWFNDAKGFGFIESPDGGKDIFVHHSAIRMPWPRKLVEGERVSFDTEETEKGLQAVNVVRLDAEG